MRDRAIRAIYLGNGLSSDSLSRFENRFDGLVEEAGDTEGKREARVVLAGFNCVNGLARHVETTQQVPPVTIHARREEREAGSSWRVKPYPMAPMFVRRQLVELIAPSWHSQSDVRSPLPQQERTESLCSLLPVV